MDVESRGSPHGAALGFRMKAPSECKMRKGGTAHKNIEAPRSIASVDARLKHQTSDIRR